MGDFSPKMGWEGGGFLGGGVDFWGGVTMESERKKFGPEMSQNWGFLTQNPGGKWGFKGTVHRGSNLRGGLGGVLRGGRLQKGPEMKRAPPN